MCAFVGLVGFRLPTYTFRRPKPALLPLPSNRSAHRQLPPPAPLAASAAPVAVTAEPTPTAEPLASRELCEEVVLEELKKVIDPELFVNIVDLGLIYVVNIHEPVEDRRKISIDMTMTSPMCPAGPQLIGNSKQVLGALPGVSEVEVRIVLDPPWTPRPHDRSRPRPTRHFLAQVGWDSVPTRSRAKALAARSSPPPGMFGFWHSLKAIPLGEPTELSPPQVRVPLLYSAIGLDAGNPHIGSPPIARPVPHHWSIALSG
jgi:metal-sulfur cluster biosynthetic enzyme